MKRHTLSYSQGIGIIEIIIALALFIIISSTGVATILGSYNSNRLSVEETQARAYAEEGIEAVRSIKTQGWYIPFLTPAAANNCTSGCTLSTTNNKWEFSPTTAPNIFDTKFSRVIKVEQVNRNAGDIVESGGTDDPDTKKITSTVTWNVTDSRTNTTSLSTYLTNFRKTITTLGQAILLYSDTINSPTVQKWRTYTDDTNSFSSENQTVAGETGRTMTIKTSPTKTEAIAGYVSTAGTLHVMCFNGTSWNEEWTQNIGGTGTTQRFDIAYEKTSGDALIVYSTNSTTNELGYRTKLGSNNCGSANWSIHTSQEAQRTTGIVHWVQLESNPTTGSNTIALLWADANSDLSAMQWTGNTWGIGEPASALETNLERVSTSQDVKSFDLALESTSGNLMIVWGLSQSTSCTAGTTIATTNCIRYARYTNSWQSVAVIPTVADPATNVDISANPNSGSNEIILAALDNSQGDLSSAYWSGSAWTGRANLDTSAHCVTAGDMLVATGWLTNTITRSIIVYHDAQNNTCTTSTSNIGAYSANGSALPTAIADFNPTPAFATPQKWYEIHINPFNKDRLILVVADSGSDLFAKQLTMTSTPSFTWSNSDGGNALEQNLSQSIADPFGFAYWRYQQP
jgi:type II secretory pathway pseudopilin PulG